MASGGHEKGNDDHQRREREKEKKKKDDLRDDIKDKKRKIRDLVHANNVLTVGNVDYWVQNCNSQSQVRAYVYGQLKVPSVAN